jgi:hypothetical protein
MIFKTFGLPCSFIRPMSLMMMNQKKETPYVTAEQFSITLYVNVFQSPFHVVHQLMMRTAFVPQLKLEPNITWTTSQ